MMAQQCLSIRANYGRFWMRLEVLPNLTSNEDHYYQRARELMLRCKDEIKFRLLELDDAPSRRKELRAEMKGIDFCVSILDKIH